MGNWRYCVAANIVDKRIDDGIERNGTVVFPPGRKVYLSKRLWRSPNEVTVMGLNRFKSKYVLERVPLAHIENIRCQKVFKPRVTELMCDDFEHHDMWWDNTDEDCLDAQMYVLAVQAISSSCNNIDADWLFTSDDCSTLSLYPYTGKAWEVGRQIQSLNDLHPYMNGYCWSSLVKYYLKSRGLWDRGRFCVPLFKSHRLAGDGRLGNAGQSGNLPHRQALVEQLRNNLVSVHTGETRPAQHKS